MRDKEILLGKNKQNNNNKTTDKENKTEYGASKPLKTVKQITTVHIIYCIIWVHQY